MSGCSPPSGEQIFPLDFEEGNMQIAENTREGAGREARTGEGTPPEAKYGSNPSPSSNTLTMKFIDGTPVPDEYCRWISAVVSEACDAEERVGIVDLDGGGR